MLFDHVGDPDVVHAFTCMFNKLRDLFNEVNIKINKQDQ